jgi:hypothetical protein
MLKENAVTQAGGTSIPPYVLRAWWLINSVQVQNYLYLTEVGEGMQNFKRYTSFYLHIFAIYCGVFTPCKNCNFETSSRDYATVDVALFSPCWAELCRAVPSRASPRLLLSDNCKRLDRATVRRGHVTSAGSAVTSHTRNAVTQQWRKLWFSACLIKGL